jgi:hypothetical protein
MADDDETMTSREIMELLNICHSALSTLRRAPGSGFPKPLDEKAQVFVYNREEINAWLVKTGRQPVPKAHLGLDNALAQKLIRRKYIG